VAPWKHWTRGRRLILGPALGLAAALTAAGCGTSVPHSTGSAGTDGSAAGAAAPAITAAQARQVFDRYVATAAKTVSPRTASSVLSLVTGVEQTVVSATLASHSVVVNGTSSNAQGAYRSSLRVKPGFDVYTYGSPTFYLPEASGYPRFFVASVTRTLQGAKPAGDGTTWPGDAQVPEDGPALLLFSQASKGAQWLLGSISQLPSGVTLPPLARDGSGYIPTVTPTAATLFTQPDYVGPLQAAVVDDGPASAATKAVAPGPLTTGMYQGAVNHVSGMTAPHGDVYQWQLDGSSLPEFALRTAAGGALVFYPMTLTTTVAVPDVINKANPIRSGAPIQVPVDVQMLLPPGQPAPLVQLSSDQTLSFAAIDPAKGTAKIQVIAVGGGLTSASASLHDSQPTGTRPGGCGAEVDRCARQGVHSDPPSSSRGAGCPVRPGPAAAVSPASPRHLNRRRARASGAAHGQVVGRNFAAGWNGCAGFFVLGLRTGKRPG
jgi:hypothetical protein